jgi:two-component system sensor histidine kinase BaeS
LACVLFFALLSNYLVRRQFDRAFEGVRVLVEDTQPPPPPPPNSEIMEVKQERLDVINLSYVFTGLLGVLLAFVLSWYLSNRISKPLAELTLATGSITEGYYGKQVDVRGGREVKDLADAFNALSENLERNEILRKNMIADISHELRNPLASQRGHLEALQDGVIEVNTEAIEVLMKNNILLTRLVEDLQQLSLVDAGQIKLDITPTHVGEIMQAAAAGFEHKISEKSISLRMDVAADLPAVMADQGRISQVLGNLLSNALLYTPQGGRITLGAKEEEGEVVISVGDTGPGIEREELRFIFDRFHRTDKSRTRETGGTGLGLSIAKGLVEAHGGRIWAESEIARGTTIFFTLPA